tara:strand:+ start:1032 stop:2243 length:1212 start_codon:yes stop_codon:yes gene_type:complete
MTFFKKDELRTLWPFYLDSLISPLLFFAPAFFVVYFLGLNFSMFQIGLIFAIAPLVSLIFEIPTGAIADLYGRKFSVLLGYFLEGILWLSLFFITDYYSILLVFGLFGFAATLSSGSKEAWVIDLVNKKNKNLVKSFFHKRQSFDAFALIISGIVGAFLVKSFGVSIIFIFGFLSFLISIFFLIFAKEYYIKKKVKIKESFKDLFKQTKKTTSYGKNHPVLYYYLIATVFFAIALTFSMGITWTPLLLELDFPEHYFGYMWSAIAFVTMISPVISHKFLKEGKEKKFIITSLLISGFLAILILFPKTWFLALIFLLSIELFVEIRRPASRIYFHRFIPSKLRATMGSINEMLSSFGGIIAVPIVGLLVDKIGARYTIMLFTPLILITILIYLKMDEERVDKSQ